MANYLPVLLVSVSTNAIPDDSSVSSMPRSQVDYLSHDWQEEDVWRSWRIVVRQKNEIANGIRLENASWRTWWKQRNKLKTVSPETLNWLKDSDVTWLYGPLHTAVDWTPPPKPLPGQGLGRDRFESSTCGKKPILKHRSISELLTSDLPSPLFSPAPSDDDEYFHRARNQGLGVIQESDEHSEIKPKRPPLLHTKSDTHIARWTANRPFRKPSPPRIIAGDVPGSEPVCINSRSSSTSGSNFSGSTSTSPSSHTSPNLHSICSSRSGTGNGSELDVTLTGGVIGSTGGKKKHISFNTFVEQFIAIEKPQTRRNKERSVDGQIGESGKHLRPAITMVNVGEDAWHQDDGYDEDEEDGFEDFEDEDGYSESDSEDSNLIEMRSSHSSKRSKSNSSDSTTSSSNSRSSRSRYPSTRTMNLEREQHVTIAPIAPTVLKTSGVGNIWRGDGLGDDYFDGSDDGVTAWLGGNGDATIRVASTRGSGKEEDSSEGTPVELVFVPPLGRNYTMKMDEGGDGEDVYHNHEAYVSVYSDSRRSQVPSLEVIPSTPSSASTVLDYPRVTSPQNGGVELSEEDAYGYYDGSDANEDLARRLHSGKGRPIRTAIGTQKAGLLKYAQGGAASVLRGRSRGTEVVHSDDTELRRVRGRSRSENGGPRSRSASRTPSPLLSSSPSTHPPTSGPLPASSRDSSGSPPASSSHLHPASRGRDPMPSEARTRGRSATRGSSSFSDRERSDPRETTSPLGSLSPDGSSMSLGIGHVYGRRRERIIPTRGSNERSSPDEVAHPESKVENAPGSRSQSASSMSSSSTISNAATLRATSGTTTKTLPIPASSTLGNVLDNANDISRLKLQDPIPHTPLAMKPRAFPHPASPLEASSISVAKARGKMSRDSMGNREGLAPTPSTEGGTFVGKAVDMAGALLEAIWHP